MTGFNMQKFYPIAGQDFFIDPICEMKVDTENPPAQFVYKGKTHYFCADACRQIFERDPEKYIQECQDED